MVGVVIIIVLLTVALVSLQRSSVLPVRTVTVQGAPKAYQSQVKQAILPYLGHNFITTNLPVLVQRLEQLPWVARVEINRRWPSDLLVQLKTQQMVAVWNDRVLLNNYAEQFPMEAVLTNEANLPNLFGPSGSEVRVMDFYQQFQRALQPIGLNIKEIRLGDGNDWQILLNNGIKVQLGQQQMLSRLKRFVKVYNKVFANSRRKAMEVSLQYPNGMAVRWGRE
jgi:cell division protein FtsQ